MEFMLYKEMFDENESLVGTALRTATQTPNQLKYWLCGYAFYKQEDGKIFAERMDQDSKDEFCWNNCSIEPVFEQTLKQPEGIFSDAIQKLESLTSIAKPYGVAPISFTPQFSSRNEMVITKLIFITTKDQKYFEVASASDFFNITTKTSAQLNNFEQNTLANPHQTTIDESGNVLVMNKILI